MLTLRLHVEYLRADGSSEFPFPKSDFVLVIRMQIACLHAARAYK